MVLTTTSYGQLANISSCSINVLRPILGYNFFYPPIKNVFALWNVHGKALGISSLQVYFSVKFDKQETINRKDKIFLTSFKLLKDKCANWNMCICSIEDDDDVSSTVSNLSDLSGLSDISGQEWKPIAGEFLSTTKTCNFCLIFIG